MKQAQRMREKTWLCFKLLDESRQHGEHVKKRFPNRDDNTKLFSLDELHLYSLSSSFDSKVSSDFTREERNSKAPQISSFKRTFSVPSIRQRENWCKCLPRFFFLAHFSAFCLLFFFNNWLFLKWKPNLRIFYKHWMLICVRNDWSPMINNRFLNRVSADNWILVLFAVQGQPQFFRAFASRSLIKPYETCNYLGRRHYRFNYFPSS